MMSDDYRVGLAGKKMSDFQELIVSRLEDKIASGAMSAASIRIERRGELEMEWAGGRRDFDSAAPPVDTESVFNVASITKPMVTSAVATLIERGLVDADDPVADYVPEFSANEKGGVTLRHCLTHTSGLPDMVPGDKELRKRNAPIGDFMDAACTAQLLFPSGTDVRYQSAGILMLGEIVERVTDMPLRNYLTEAIFTPTGMTSTNLGWREDFESVSVTANVGNGVFEGGDDATSHWNHNSQYWREFGAPWGGVHSTAGDVIRLLQLMLNDGTSSSGATVFRPHTVRMMLQDYTMAQPGLSTAARLLEGWGMGWRIQRTGDGGWYGSGVPAGAFGHAGSTGTVAWADPNSGVAFTLLTNGLLDVEGGTLKACGNIAASALCAG